MSIPVTLISVYYSSTLISLQTNFNQDKIVSISYSHVAAILSLLFKYNCFHSFSSFDLIAVSKSVEF